MYHSRGACRRSCAKSFRPASGVGLRQESELDAFEDSCQLVHGHGQQTNGDIGGSEQTDGELEGERVSIPEPLLQVAG